MQSVQPRMLASHLSAARLYDMRLPRRVLQPPSIHLTANGGGGHAPGAASVIGHRGPVAGADIWRRDGIPLTSPARTLLDLSSWNADARRPMLTGDELVAVIDGVIVEHLTGMHSGVEPLRRKPELVTDIEAFAGRRGARRLRQALERSMPGVDSPLETETRLVLERHALRGWRTDVELAPPGYRRVWPDLADPVHRLSLQCDGAVHDDERQRIRDIERQRATEAAGWTEIRVLARDLRVSPWDPPGTEPMAVRMVRAARTASRR